MNVAEEEQRLEVAYRERSRDSFRTYVRGLEIPSADGKCLFSKCIAPYQSDCFDDLAPSLHALRDHEMPPIRRFWWERTKKASKDADISLALLWLLAFPVRPLYLQVGAADRDQAAIVKRRIQAVLHLNPWLDELVDINSWKIASNCGKVQLDILAADIAGSHGETPDLLVVNELSHVTKWEFVENLLDNADGVARGIVIVATNAGFKGTKAEVLRRNAIRSNDWYYHQYDKPAPWILEESLEDAKRRNSRSRYRRLWLGVWASGKGDALDEEDIDRCLRSLNGPSHSSIPGYRYLAGLDLGVSHDHAGMAVVGVSEAEQVIDVAEIQAWEPGDGPDGEVDLQAVEDAVYGAWRRYNLSWVGYDPSQAKLMAQRLSRRGVPMQQVTFTGGNLTAMADGLMQVMKSGKLRAYDDDEGRLRRDFGKFTIVEKSYGYRLEAVSDEYGHADVGTALVITLPRALDMLRGMVGGLDPDDDIGLGDDGDLTEKEIEDMPDGLRELYEMEEDEERRYSLVDDDD